MPGISIADIDVAIGSTEFSRAEITLIARVADELGVGSIYVTEGTGRDAFSVLNEIALNTRRVGLGTGIVNVFSRTPTAVAQATASVMELMGDRGFRLGLGTSGKLLMQKYHGARFDRPVSRLGETVQVIDHAFRTGRLPEGGDLFPLGGLPLGVTAPRERLTILVAGLTERTVELTARHADGWLPIWLSLTRGTRLLRQLESAAEAAGRPRPAVSGYFYGGVGDGPGLAGHLRSTLAWYVAANGTAYRRLFERFGYAEEAKTICDLWASGDRPAARASVPGYLLDDTTLAGNAPDFLRKAGRFIRAGVDRPVLRLPRQVSAAQCVEMLGALAGAGVVNDSDQ